jgi:hypothetical protein
MNLHLDEKYSASSLCAWGLTLSGAMFGVAGILALFITSTVLNLICVVALASMTAFAVACANFAAAAAMHSFSGASHVHWPTFWPSLALTLIFAFGSAGGVHLGWLVLADMAPNPEKLPPVHMVDIAAAVLCVAKPAMTWIIEGRKAIDVIAAREAVERDAEERRIATAADRDRLAAEERIAKAKAPPVSGPGEKYADPMQSRPFPPTDTKTGAKIDRKVDKPLRTKAPVGRIARAVAGVTMATTAATALPAAATEAPRPARTDAQSKPPAPPETAAEQRAVAMMTDGASLRAAERETGLSYARVRALKEWVSRAA